MREKNSKEANRIRDELSQIETRVNVFDRQVGVMVKDFLLHEPFSKSIQNDG